MRNNILNALLAAVTLLVATTFCTPPDQTYDNNDFSFSYPGRWVIADESPESDVRYIELKRKTILALDRILLSWFDNSIDLSVEGWIEQFLTNMTVEFSEENVSVAPEIVDTFGNYPARIIKLTILQDEVTVNTTVHIVEAETKTVFIIYTSGTVDGFKNDTTAFELIENTFILK